MRYLFTKLHGKLLVLKNKKIKNKGLTIAKLVFVRMFCREKSISQIIEKVHKRKKLKDLKQIVSDMYL